VVNVGESFVESVEVSGESGVAVTIKGGPHLPGNSLNENVFAVECAVAIFEMVHFLLYPPKKLWTNSPSRQSRPPYF
jgi:hypothetical protein